MTGLHKEEHRNRRTLSVEGTLCGADVSWAVYQAAKLNVSLIIACFQHKLQSGDHLYLFLETIFMSLQDGQLRLSDAEALV